MDNPTPISTAPASPREATPIERQLPGLLPVLANYFIVSVMMACVAAGMVGLGRAFAPTWNGDYLVVVVFLITFESLYTARATRKIAVPSREWLSVRASEVIAIVILLKALIYVLRGPAQLLQDLQLWQDDFLANFFTGEYLAAVVIVISLWLLSRTFNQELLELEADDATLERERRFEFRVDRNAFRKQLMLKVVLTGTVLVLTTVFARFYFRTQGNEAGFASVGMFNLLLYVVMGFLLLSQTRYSALRAAWFRERATLSGEVARRWALYSIAFLVLVAVVVSVLPTRYSVGLLGSLGYAIGLILTVLQILVYLLVLILSLPLNLLMSLLGKPGVSPAAPPQMPKPPPPQTVTPTGSDPLLELLQSLLFWAIFLLVVGYALWHYLGRNRDLLALLRRLPVLSWLLKGWTALWNTLRHWRGELVKAVDERLRRARTPNLSTAVDERVRLMNLRKLGPRERVQYFYLAMVRRATQRGMARQPAQTPREYAAMLDSALDSTTPEVEQDIDSLTDSFVEARYSRHDISLEQAGRVQTYWERIRAALRRR
jgi:hypothetical protein